MKAFLNENQRYKASVAWTILVALILSVLLLVPAPVLALDYNTTLQSYVLDVKTQLDSVVKSVRELPNLSYENGRNALTEIDTRLQKIQADSANRAKDFKNLSDNAQKEYEKNISEISQSYTQQEKGKLIVFANTELNPPTFVNTKYKDSQPRANYRILKNPSNNSVTVNISAEGIWQWSKDTKDSSDANGDPYNRFCRDCKYPDFKIGELVTLKPVMVDSNTGRTELKPIASGRLQSIPLRSGEKALLIFNDGYYSDNDGSQTINYSVTDDVTSAKNIALEKANQQLSEGIVLTNKISKLCDDLGKRVDLASQKFGNVKEYASILNSFSDPDVVNEIKELDKLVVDLTKNLPNAS